MLTVENEIMAKCQSFSTKPFFDLGEAICSSFSPEYLNSRICQKISYHLLNTGYIRFESQIKTNVYTNAHSKC